MRSDLTMSAIMFWPHSKQTRLMKFKEWREIQRLRAELERAHRDLVGMNEALEAVQVPVSSQIPIRQVCRMSALALSLTEPFHVAGSVDESSLRSEDLRVY